MELVPDAAVDPGGVVAAVDVDGLAADFVGGVVGAGCGDVILQEGLAIPVGFLLDEFVGLVGWQVREAGDDSAAAGVLVNVFKIVAVWMIIGQRGLETGAEGDHFQLQLDAVQVAEDADERQGDNQCRGAAVDVRVAF